MPLSSARAQAFTWGGTGSTTTTTDYNLGTNWSSPPIGAPPVVSGQSAVFDTTGSATVAVTSGSIAPDSWTFTAGAQFYSISGGAVNFSRAGASGGIIDNANSGQTISISNNIGESAAGVQVQLLNNSTLILSGSNSYSGGTTVSNFGSLQVTNNNAVGTGTVALSIGMFQAGGASNLTFGNNFNISDTVSGNIIDANGVKLTLNGNITGTGQLTVQDSSFGAGALILNGTNTYTGGTTICTCGTLQLGDAAHTGSIVGAVTNENIFNIVNANTAGITSIVNDDGLTTFFNATSASSAVITNKNGGETDFGMASGTDTATAGKATIVNRSGSSTVFFAMTTAGSATITNRFLGTTAFLENSSAGNATIVNRFGGLTIFNGLSAAGSANITNRFGGSTLFVANSSAGNATITNNSFGGISGPPVGLGFFDASTAGTATIVNNNNGFIAFGLPFGFDTSSADHATITNNAGSGLEFNAFTTAGNATITTNSGGAVKFFDNSTGGNAQFITNGTGYVDFGESFGPNADGRITAGSIAGSGFYYIGGWQYADRRQQQSVDQSQRRDRRFQSVRLLARTRLAGKGRHRHADAFGHQHLYRHHHRVRRLPRRRRLDRVVEPHHGECRRRADRRGHVGNTTIASGGIFLPGNGRRARR